MFQLRLPQEDLDRPFEVSNLIRFRALRRWRKVFHIVSKKVMVMICLIQFIPARFARTNEKTFQRASFKVESASV
jgi:hypothetical protein